MFLNDKNALYDAERKTFREQECRKLATDHHIALNDTAREIRRLKGNASDKYLEILKPVPLQELLDKIPDCHTVATTGEKAAEVIASLTGTAIPKIGEMVESDSGLRIWRMPSTSRAYPMKMELKAEYYARLFRDAGCFS